ncbi:tRNA-intron lyase, partial [Candidatus Woesearchaeota archaeon]|nr:tRNA-intron lyase [Candidatus Woesearchaeota archaeon]
TIFKSFLNMVKKKEQPAEKEPSEKIKAKLIDGKLFTETSDAARELFNQSRYGDLQEGRLNLSLIEGLFLMEKGKIEILDGRGKPINFEKFVKKASKTEPNLVIRYAVFKDLRNRGYIVKTALKFGADFRVYDRGVKPGEDHAKWVVYPVHEGSTLTWYEFAAKNRVAHSTKKRLLLGVVDDESDVSFWECRWIRP